MVLLAKVELVEKLLAGGVSQRQTAIRAGVSRCTVARIKIGRWRREYRARLVRRMNRELKSNGKIVQCPSCGAKVELPCRACRVRGLLAAGRLDRKYAYAGRENDEQLVIQIQDPDSMCRYTELLRRKRREIAGDGEAVWDAEGNVRTNDEAAATNDEPTDADLAAIDEQLSEQL